MKNIIKKMVATIIITTILLISIFNFNVTKKVYAEQQKIEFYFETMDGQKSISNETFKNTISDYGRGAATYRGIELNIFAKSLTSSLDLATMDLIIKTDDKYGFKIREFISDSDDYGYAKWIDNTNRYPNIANNLSLYFDAESGSFADTIDNKGVLIGTITIEINKEYESEISDLQLEFSHTEDSINNPNSTDITYGTGAGEGYRLDEIILTPFNIGNPNAGPDASLKSLKVEGETNTYLDLSGDIDLNQEITISYADSINNSLSFNFETLRSDATTLYVENFEPKETYVDDDIVKIKVTHEGETKTYEIKINVTPANDDTSLDININTTGSGFVVSKTFDETTNTFDVVVSYSTTELEITPIIHELSTVDKESLNFINLKKGETTDQTIEVTSESGTKNNYIIKVTREMPNDESSYDLNVDGNQVQYIDDKYSYLLSEAKDNFTIEINNFHKLSKVEYKTEDGNYKNLPSSGQIFHNSILKGETIKYTIKITTEAETEVERTLEIKRPESSNANLKDITITEIDAGQTNTSKPIRENNTYTYVVTYSDNGKIILSGEGIADENATVEFFRDGDKITEFMTSSLSYGDNEITIRVTAQNDKDINEYTLIVKKLSDKKELVEITLRQNNPSGTKLANGWSENNEEKKFYYDGSGTYSINIPYGNVSTFYLRLESSLYSTIELNGSKSSNNITTTTNTFTSLDKQTISYTLKIYDEKSNNTSNPVPVTYNIVINREAADVNNKLQDIKVNEVSINGFNPDKLNYSRQVFDRGTENVYIQGFLPEDSLATIKYEYIVSDFRYENQTIPLSGTTPVKVEITVTSQSGASRVYNLEFVAGSDENKITSISLSNDTGYNFPFSFNQATTAYNITVPYTVNYVSVSATASEAATITGATDYVLTAGEGRTITVYATSELNTKGQEYKITITREQGRNYKELSQLSYLIDGFPEVTFNLYSTEYKYEALQSYNRNITSVEITARISGSQGERFEEVEGTEFKETYELKPGKNELLIYVLDEMGKRQTYTVVIDIYDDNNTFSTINVDNIDYDLSSFKNNQLIIEKEYLFNDGDVKFVVNKESAYSELKITANNNAKYHTTPGYGMLDFKAGFTTIVKFSITAENGTESEEYEVHITKLAANKLTSLNELKISLPNGNSIYSETNLSGNNTINLRVDRNVDTINIGALLNSNERSTVSGLNLENQFADYKNYSSSFSLNPAGTTTTIFFEVIAEDNITKSRYTINIIRKNVDSEVLNLTIKNQEKIIYNGDYEDISLDEFANSVNNLTFILTLNDPFARVFVGQSQRFGDNGIFEFVVPLVEGDNKINLSVRTELLNTDTPNNEYSTNDIEITYSRKVASSVAELDTLTITYNNGNDVLISYTNEDNIPTVIDELNLIRDIKSIFITATAKDGGTVTGQIGNRNLTPGKISSFSLQVTPENKGEGREYTIYISNKNEDNTIKNITIDGNNINFDEDVYTYDLTTNPYPYTKEDINIFVETDNFASLTNAGIKQLNYNLVDGINEFEVYATSELGEVGSKYKIIVKVIPPYENTNLESLEVTDEEGTILPFVTEYTQGYFSYTINLEPNQNINQITILAKLLNDEKQLFDRDLSTPISIVTNQDGTIDQTITFVVSAENNKKSEYTIRINKGLVLSDSNDIINIAIAEVNNFLFNQATTAYELTVPYSINFLTLNVTASEKANITGSGKHNLNEGETQIIVYATSESGKEGIKYTITLTRLEASTNSKLDEIVINTTDNLSNYLLGNNDRNPKVTYNKEISTYEINLGIEYLGKIIRLTTTKGHPYQEIQLFNITGNSKQLTYGENQFSILVTAEDTNYATTYFVVINVKNETNDLEQLIINSENINFKEDPINPYITEEKTATITYKGLNNGEVILYDSNNNSITSGSTVNLLEGDNDFTIIVKNEYGEEVDSYEFTITRNPSKDITIADAKLFDIFNTNYLSFNKDILEYDISVSSNIEKLTLNVSANHPSAVVTGNGTYNIKLDDITTIEFYLTAEDGITVSDIYVINVLRESLSTNKYLDEITIRTLDSTYILGNTFRNPMEEFVHDSQLQTINLDIDYVGKSLIVGYTKGHNNQKVTLIGLVNNTTLILKEGLNTFSIDIQPEDPSAEPFVYTININVRNKDNDLEHLFINNQPINLGSEVIELETEEETALIDYQAKNNGKVTIKDQDGNDITNNLDLDYGDNLITIIIENEYNEVVKEYEINIIRNKSSDNNILDVILIDNENYNYLNFNKETPEYNIKVPYYIDNVDLLINASHYLASTYINNVLTNTSNFILVSGEELTINFYVIAENDDESNHYTINIIRDYNVDNKLSSLSVTTNKETLLENDFNKDNNNYYFQVNEEHTNVIFEFELNYGQTVTNIISGVSHPINHGINIFEIEVYAEDPNLESFVYTIEIEMINSSIEIEEILVDNKNIYEEGKTNYILEPVSSDINETHIVVNPKDENTTIVITVDGKEITDGLIKLVPGQNEVIVTITSEDGSNTEEYTITIEQLLETYDLLDEISIITNLENYLLGLEDKTPKVLFNPETFTYSITVNELVEFIKLGYELGSQKQTIIGDFDVELKINHGLNTFIVEVYPEDPKLEGNIYTIEITKVYENIDLESLLVNGEDIFEENQTNYELDNLTTDTKTIIVFPTLTNEYGTYEIKDNKGNIINNNEVPIYFGNNEITITLTSEDGSITKEYTINVKQVLSNNNEVIDLEVIDLSNNVNKIIFDSNTLTYDVKFNYSNDIARIRVTTNDKAKVYINNVYKAINREDFVLVPGESRLVSIYVEAEDGTKGEVYQVNLYRMTEDEGRMSDNNKLRDLKLEIPLDEIPFDFNQNKLEYVITVPYSASEIYLKGYPEHHGAIVHNEGAYRLKVGINDPIYIRVQAEDGTPSRIQYKVTFVREEPNTDTSLKDLVVKDLNGNILEFDNNVKFDSDNRIYTITLDKESFINQVRIETELNNPTQKVFGNGVLSLHGEIEGQYNTVLPVTVVAEDGSSEDYIIYILHDLDFSNITEIKDISIIGDDRISYFGLEFEGDVYNYDVYVPFNVLETRLIVQTLGNVIYLDNKDNEIEDNRLQQFSSNNLIIYRFKIQSMNEQNESQIYEIKVNREVADSNALLETILIDGKEILGFDPNQNNYLYIQYILDPNKIDLLAKPQSETSIVSGNRTYTLTEGESTFISITVTAQDKTTNTYIVEVKYVNSNALLGELSVYELDEFGNEFQIPIELKPGEFNYTVQIDRNTSLINIKGSGEDQGGARLRGFGQYRIGDTDLVIPITVTSGDGTEERTYLVTITKSMRGDASLETVLINDGNGNIVYDFTAPYKVSNDSNIITLSAKPKDGNARVYFNDEYSSNGQFNINDLNPGQTSILIRVESEDGQTVKTYVVNLAKDYQPDLLLTILLITSLLLWIITILVLIIRKNRKEKVDQNQLIF